MNLTGQQPYQKGQKRRRKVTEHERLDREFRAWVRLQPSCISGQFSEWKNGVGMCIAAHVRRASDAGTGYKPLFSAVPLTDAEHRHQHNHGESAMAPPEWFEAQADKYLATWKETRNHGKDSV